MVANPPLPGAEREAIVCENPRCRKPFVPAKDWQIYCTKTCGNQVRTQRYKKVHRPGGKSIKGSGTSSKGQGSK